MNYKAKLDKIFSEYIRLRDATLGDGYGTCISCGKIIYWKDNHCGHFINRKHMALRFNEITYFAK
jgi:transposase